MTKFENRILEFVKKHYIVFFIVAITFVGAFMRVSGMDFESGDWHGFFSIWYHSILTKGQLGSLQYQIGDYNVLFQFIVAIFTHIPLEPLYLFKMLAICFDFSLAVGCAACVYELVENRKKEIFVLAYSLVWLSPFVVFNSAYWVQTDSIYTSFVIWALFFLMKKHNVMTFICLGIALAFKIQVLFVLPFFIFIYVLNKSFSLLHFLITVFVGWLSSLPGIIKGRGIFTFFEIYGAQHGELHDMTLNYPNFWAVVGGVYEHTEGFAVWITTAAFGIGMFILLSKKVSIDTKDKAVSLLIWSIWTVVMFMPGMHDRYGYLLEITLLVATIMNVRKYGIYTAGVYASTLIVYSNYLFERGYDIVIWAMLYIALYVVFSYRVFGVEMKVSEPHSPVGNQQ